jgi:exodeoxyribonuclease V gamma subunit
MAETALTPGFMAVHSNHPEALRDLMLAWMARHPLAPLENERVLVQSNGVAQWLKMSLARHPADGGAGIAAALQVELPSRFIWQAYRSVLGTGSVPSTSPFDRALLVWRLMRLLPALLQEDVFAPLARFLDGDDDMRKRHQLAQRLADLFDQYQVYRADWLAAWAAGQDVVVTGRGAEQPVPAELAWQPRLWRALREDVGAAQADGGRANVHQRFLETVAQWQGEPPAELPRRLVVFGISSLPQQAIDVLGALSRWVQVLMCVHNPCEHDWSHIVADKDLLRVERHRQRRRAGSEAPIADDALHLHAQPLLAAWGKQGRDYIRLLDQHDDQAAYAAQFLAIDQRIDHFAAHPGDTLLRQLQDDIRDLRPLAETRAHWPPVDATTDQSLCFHVAHSPQREVEVLHDQLLAAFAADPALSVRDVVVMVPDIATYAPHVEAVFGLLPPGDPRHVAFNLADRVQRHHDPLLVVLESLLRLPDSRLASSDILDWLEVPALRARFNIDAQDLPLLQRWIAAANIRWGLHAEHRQSLDLPTGMAHNSWDFGLQRMLLGYATGEGDAWLGIEPLDEVGGLDAAVLGPLVQLLGAAEALWRDLATPATPSDWRMRLRAVLSTFFATEGGADGFTLLKLESTLQDWAQACESAGLVDELPLSVVREDWLTRLDDSALEQSFLAGAVTFATLLPMRAIPFRFVALLGMNDGDYPRSRTAMDFDLMRSDYRPGDRSRREDDRYLFLEALLSARERLHVSWVGRSIHDQSERPPSVLVAQLRDHIAAGWRLGSDDRPDDTSDDPRCGERLLDALTVTHRLQPFDDAYFTNGHDARLFSYAREWHAALASPAVARGDGAPLAPYVFEGPLTLQMLGRFLKDPVKAFFQQRLRVHLELEDPVSADQEPFELNALENWQLQDELIQAQVAAIANGEMREPVLQAQLARMAGRGDLPAGQFAELLQARLGEPMDKMFADYLTVRAQWPHALPDALVESTTPALSGALLFSDHLDRLFANAQGDRCRVLIESSSVVAKGVFRLDKLLMAWVAHVAGHLDGEPLTTCIVSKAGSATLRPMDPGNAQQYWSVLLDAWREGMCRPLPLAIQTAQAWLKSGGAAPEAASKAHAAARVTYEVHEPAFKRFSEREGNPALARAFTDFDALWSDGEFARWVTALIQPLDSTILRSAAKAGSAASGDNE